MCLIIYSPESKRPPRGWFAEAAVTNPDGIGVMSADGVAKFLGKRKTRRAWRYVSQLASEGLPYAVHFRWATHGRVSRSNCHPFEIPGTGAYLMHNGVLWTARFANAEVSDTYVFANDVMPGYVTMAQRGAHDYLTALGAEADGNRLLVMHADGKRFDVVNRHLWESHGGVLYSNTYSIADMCSSSSASIHSPKTSLGSWIKGSVSRRWSKPALPSGPTLSDAEDDYSAFAEDCAEDELWARDYEDALDSGYDPEDADRWAEKEADKREMMTRHGVNPYAEAKRAGFDWHKPETWNRYPIPGTEYTERVLNRHGDGEPEYTAPDARDMFI